MKPIPQKEISLLRERRLDTQFIESDMSKLLPTDLLQKLQDSLSETVGVPLLFVSSSGVPITRAAGIEMFCRQMTRAMKIERPCGSCKRTEKTAASESKPHRCAVGLTDVVLPITAGDIEIGYLVTSQTTTEPGAPRTVEAARRSGMPTAGALSYAARIPVRTEDQMRSAAQSLSAVVSLVSEVAKVTREKKISETRDPISGLVTREYFWKSLAAEIEMSDTYNYPISLMMIDIADFHQINSAYGHDAGDCVIREVAQAISTEIRQSDIASRYSGARFLVMLTACDTTGAEVVAWRIKNKLASLDVKVNGQKLNITARTSIVSRPESAANNPDDLFKELDAAMKTNSAETERRAA